MMHLLGGGGEKAPVREYGKIEVITDRTLICLQMFLKRRSAG